MAFTTNLRSIATQVGSTQGTRQDAEDGFVETADLLDGISGGVDVAQVIDRLSTDITLVSTTTETSMYNFTIPENALVASNMIRANCLCYIVYNNSASDNLRFKIETPGRNLLDTSIIQLNNGINASPALVMFDVRIWQRSSGPTVHVSEARLRIHDQSDGAIGVSGTNITEYVEHNSWSETNVGGINVDFRAQLGTVSANLSLLSLGGIFEKL